MAKEKEATKKEKKHEHHEHHEHASPIKVGDKFICPHCKAEVPMNQPCPTCKADIDWSKI